MDNERVLQMDPYILLSIINMKLRDEFGSLNLLCEQYDLEEQIINDKLNNIGYTYNHYTNQFIHEEVQRDIGNV